MKLNNKICVALAALLLSATAVYPSSPNSSDTGKAYKSSRKADDMRSVLSKKKRLLRAKLASKGYRIADAFTQAPKNLNSETAVEEMYLAFKEAYAKAVTNLILEETQASITSDLKSHRESSQGAKASNAAQCKKEYLAKQAALERAENRYNSSDVGKTLSVVERIANKFAPQDGVTEEEKTKEEGKKALNTLIQCEAKIPHTNIQNTLTKNMSGDVFGVRIMDTVLNLNKGEIGVIIGRSPESSKDAGILKEQNKAAKSLPNAYDEVSNRVMVMIDEYEKENREPPFGIFGVRGFRLSNGEMAYVGFGTAIQNEAMDELDSNANALAADLADTKAMAALVEFSYMTASSQSRSEIKKTIEKTITETLDMSKNGEKTDFHSRLESRMRAVMKQDLSARSQGFLKAPQNIDNSAWNGGDMYPDFYLSAWAWSPSLMTNATRQHQNFENAYEDGKRGSMGVVSGSGSQTQPGIKSFKVKEDW